MSPRRRGGQPRFIQTVAGRRWLWGLGIVLAAAALGYLVAFLVFPAPLVSEDHSVSTVFGLPQAEAVRELEQQGFRVRVEEAEPDPVQPPGYVIWQDPAAFTVLEEGATVRIVPSAGPAQAPTPDVVGFDFDLASRTLGAAGLRVGTIDTIAAGAEPGVVVATRPGAGAGRTAGATIDLVVSRGPATIRVPNLVGLSEEDARVRLLNAGLRVGGVRPRPSPPDTPIGVLEQRPAAGTLASRDSRVDIVVSRPPGADR